MSMESRDASGDPGKEQYSDSAHTMSLVSLCLGLGGLTVTFGAPLIVWLGAGAGVSGIAVGVTSMRRHHDMGGTSIAGIALGGLAVISALLTTY